MNETRTADGAQPLDCKPGYKLLIAPQVYQGPLEPGVWLRRVLLGKTAFLLTAWCMFARASLDAFALSSAGLYHGRFIARLGPNAQSSQVVLHTPRYTG
ncbi:hypothetical protein BIW11_00785, partial [Tropilaelaps mercedesae]